MNVDEMLFSAAQTPHPDTHRVRGTLQRRGLGFAAAFHPEIHGLGSASAGGN